MEDIRVGALSIRFEGEEGAALIALTTPCIFGSACSTELAEVIEAPAGGSPDRDALAAVMPRHGLTPVG